jgi:hypothetical protein
VVIESGRWRAGKCAGPHTPPQRAASRLARLVAIPSRTMLDGTPWRLELARAQQLFITLATVETHLTRTYRKLGIAVASSSATRSDARMSP